MTELFQKKKETNDQFIELKKDKYFEDESDIGLLVALNDSKDNNERLFRINQKVPSKPILANFKELS